MVRSGGASAHAAHRGRGNRSLPLSARAGAAPPGQQGSWPFRVPGPSADAVIIQPSISAICAADKMTMGGGSGWKFTLASCAVPLVTAQVRKARRSCARVELGWEVFTTAYS